MVKRPAQVDQLAFAVVFPCVLTGRGCGDACDERGIGESRRNAPGYIRRRGALGNILDAAIRQRDVNLFHARLHPEEETSSLSAGSRGVKAMPAVIAALRAHTALCVRVDGVWQSTASFAVSLWTHGIRGCR